MKDDKLVSAKKEKRNQKINEVSHHHRKIEIVSREAMNEAMNEAMKKYLERTQKRSQELINAFMKLEQNEQQ